jgi:hypothetical protein
MLGNWSEDCRQIRQRLLVELWVGVLVSGMISAWTGQVLVGSDIRRLVSGLVGGDWLDSTLGVGVS